jgi:MFS family permease
MLSIIRAVSPLLSSTVFLLMGVALLHSHVALYGHALGFSVAMIGVLTSAYYTGFLAGTYAVQRLTHRIGHIRSFAFCIVLVTFSALVQAVTSIYVVWLLMRILQGLVLVGQYAIIESWLNASADRRHRSSVFAVYMMLNLGAAAVAQQFLRLPGEPFVLFCVVAMLFCVAGLPIIATREAQPTMEALPKVELRRLYRLAPTALVTSLISGLALGALWGLLPIYAQARGMAPGEIGTYVAAAILGGVVMQWPLGRFSDRIDRRLAIALISGCAALVALANVVLPADNRALATVMVFAFGGVAFALYPIAVAHLVDYVDRGELLSASSTVLLVNGTGSAVGPLAAGALRSWWQPGSLFAWFAVLNAVLALYALNRFARRKRVVPDDDNFVPLVQTALNALRQKAVDKHLP